MTLTPAFAEDFARRWLADWNAHDLERILSHYADAVEFTGPVVSRVIGEESGRLHGRAALRAYWQRALQLAPQLHFEFIALMVGVDSLVIHYRGLGGRLCAEFFEFDDAGHVKYSAAHGALD